MSNFKFLQELLNTVADQSRIFLPRAFFPHGSEQGLQELAQALMSVRGEASGVAIARQLAHHYEMSTQDAKLSFFSYLANTLKPNTEKVCLAAQEYMSKPNPDNLVKLQNSLASPLQEFFRRVNSAAGGTAEIVRMRSDLIGFMRTQPDLEELRIIDRDVEHLLQSWFNRGFLVLRRIDWNTPASILDKIIAYEAVHQINGWDDLRRRLNPADRRCFAFFHPSLVDEPLIFVQVALMNEIPANISSVLALEPSKLEEETAPTTAVFYSISNCQNGLRGISFGNFLIKQVVEELSRECPSLRTFVTLSPVPGFASWLENLADTEHCDILGESTQETVTTIRAGEWAINEALVDKLEPSMQALAAAYLLNARNNRGQPVDPVARFHLGNGARLERINWPADLSSRGLRQAHGLMVNYLYVLGDIEKNHEAYANDGTIAAGRSIRSMVKVKPRSHDAAAKDKSDASAADAEQETPGDVTAGNKQNPISSDDS
ncbi:MAG: malonyl-CoA decarboxylase [Pseudomonadota bacterium]